MPFFITRKLPFANEKKLIVIANMKKSRYICSEKKYIRYMKRRQASVFVAIIMAVFGRNSFTIKFDGQQ